jgi:hypothetical protein
MRLCGNDNIGEIATLPERNWDDIPERNWDDIPERNWDDSLAMTTYRVKSDIPRVGGGYRFKGGVRRLLRCIPGKTGMRSAKRRKMKP